jgi:ABC-type dipeptide/oligopeptide/nickel transport system permease subunit
MEKITNRPDLTKQRFIFWSVAALLLLISAVLGPLFIPHDPFKVNLAQVNRRPSREYIMGTDYIGRCIFCRLVKGAGRSIYAAIIVVVITFIIGTIIGVICGYFGGTIDTVLMRIVDSIQSFPNLIFTVAVAGMLGAGILNCVIAMTAVGWTGYARLARSQVIAVKERTFVDAARISGMNSLEILLKTILPNSLRPLVVSASLHIGNSILSFAGLSYLGLGTSPPYPEWGMMLNNGREKLLTAPWAAFFPGLAILLVVMIMGMFGDSINEMLNPQKRQNPKTSIGTGKKIHVRVADNIKSLFPVMGNIDRRKGAEK